MLTAPHACLGGIRLWRLCVATGLSSTSVLCSTMPTLHIQLLGGFQLHYNDAPVVTVIQARQQSLLAYLLLHRHAPQSRQHLAFLFWPDSTEAQARTNLRRELYQLRHTLPEADQFLAVGAQTVQWRADASYTLDVTDFERALAVADEAQRLGQIATVCTWLAQAIKVYTDDLLPSCYDEWMLNDREQLRQRYLSALERLVQLLEEQGQHRDAIEVAERLLRHDPIHEQTYQRLMRLHVLNGDRAHALRVYHLCTAALQRELSVEPSPETHALYEQLLAVEVAPHVSAKPVPVPVVEGGQLVARQAEWQQLQSAWHVARRNKIHFALIAGEAGIGKTRLAEELLTWASQHAVATAKTRSYAAEGRLAYAPVVEWLRSDAIQAPRLPLGDVWLREVARLLPEVIEERPDLPHPGPLTESWQRLRFFEALARAVLLGSQPLLLLLDDLQWCDQDTLEWLRYLMRFAQGAAVQPQSRERLLIVGTARSEEVGAHHPLKTLILELRNTEQLTEIELGLFSEAETTQLARAVAGHALDTEQLAQLYRDTAGNPLFVVETLRSGGGERSATLLRDRPSLADEDAYLQSPRRDDRILPPKIYAVIESRLAQLSPPARELAALAAVIGRAFTLAVLATAGDADEATLVQALDELWQRRILHEHGAGGYDFSHDRIRDVAYAGISPARSRLLHRRVAQALEQTYHADLDPVSGQIAGHYAQAGLPEPALRYYEQAALVAQQFYAHEDAVASLTKALALLPQLPLTPERLRQELRLQLDLGHSLGTLKGFAAPEIRELYGRANALAAQVGDDEQRQMVISGLFSFHIWRLELQSARALAEQGIPLAERISDRSWLGEAYGRLGVVLLYLGQWQASRSQLEQAIAAIGDLHRPPPCALRSRRPVSDGAPSPFPGRSPLASRLPGPGIGALAGGVGASKGVGAPLYASTGFERLRPVSLSPP